MLKTTKGVQVDHQIKPILWNHWVDDLWNNRKGWIKRFKKSMIKNMQKDIKKKQDC
jgi:hypothetical protein